MIRSAVPVLPLVVGLLAACPAEPEASDAASAPTLEELRHATYRGLEGSTGPVTLTDGAWEGEPVAPGSATRPVVKLAGDLRVVGDLDGDGIEEAAVLLEAWTGGTGTFVYLAVVGRSEEGVENRATALLGDRVQVRGMRIEGGRLLVDVLEGGPEDAACCPGELATRGFALSADGLAPIDAGVTPARLSLAALGETDWVLRFWDRGEEAAPEPEVTLQYREGRFAGTSGCNRYAAPVKEGDGGPASIQVGLGIGTRMACPDPAGAIEARFLRQLEGVNSFGWVAGRLRLSYEGDGAAGAMLFDRRRPPAQR